MIAYKQPAKPQISFVAGNPSFARTMSFQATGDEEDPYSHLGRNSGMSPPAFSDTQFTYSNLGQANLASKPYGQEIYTEPVVELETYSTLQRPQQPEQALMEPEQSTYSTLNHAAPAAVPQQENYSVLMRPEASGDLILSTHNYQNEQIHTQGAQQGIYDDADGFDHPAIYENNGAIVSAVAYEPTITSPYVNVGRLDRRPSATEFNV